MNVEYNQVEGVFKELGGEPMDGENYSIYPGNINCFAIRLAPYLELLHSTKGCVSEFINPKYADASKTVFKSSARLECMMQEFSKEFTDIARVGVVSCDKAYCFTTVKNDPATAAARFKAGLIAESASTCEADLYAANRRMLRQCGASVEDAPLLEFGGIELGLYPMVYLSPSFATCLTELKSKVGKLKISAKSALTVLSNCELTDVELDGKLVVDQEAGVTVRHLDKDYVMLSGTKGSEQPHLLIRQYKVL